MSFQDPIESSVRKAGEKLRELYRGVKDPEYRSSVKNQRWLRIPRKYWTNELEDLNIYERGVLCTLISYMNLEREAWPSNRTIAKILKINVRTSLKAYQSLLKKNVIKQIGWVRSVRKVKIL